MVTTRAGLVTPIWGLGLSKVRLMAEEETFYQGDARVEFLL